MSGSETSCVKNCRCFQRKPITPRHIKRDSGKSLPSLRPRLTHTASVRTALNAAGTRASKLVGAAIVCGANVALSRCRAAAFFAAPSRLRRGFGRGAAIAPSPPLPLPFTNPSPTLSIYERCPHDVSNVPSNITMTVIAALINADTAARRQPVTPLGFNAILSGVALRSFLRCVTLRYLALRCVTLRIVAVGGCIAYVPTTLLRGFVAPLPFGYSLSRSISLSLCV